MTKSEYNEEMARLERELLDIEDTYRDKRYACVDKILYLMVHKEHEPRLS